MSRFSRIFLITLIVTTGCVNSFSASPRDFWGEGAESGSANLRSGRNFYTADLDRYPSFGIFIHSIAAKKYSAEVEMDALTAGLQRCRADFSLASNSDSLRAYDTLWTHKDQWISQTRFVRFRPKWVVIIIRNTEHGGDANDPLQPDLTVGYVLPATDVFDSTITPEDLLKRGFRDDHPVHRDPHPTFPGYRDVYSIIERFRARNTDVVEEYLKKAAQERQR